MAKLKTYGTASSNSNLISRSFAETRIKTFILNKTTEIISLNDYNKRKDALDEIHKLKE